MPVFRTIPIVFVALSLAACGGPYPTLMPTAELLAEPTAAPEATPETTEALAARGAALEARAAALRAEPSLGAADLPPLATPPTP